MEPHPPRRQLPATPITAVFLRVDHTRIAVGFRTVTDGMYILCADLHEPTRTNAWAVIDFEGSTSPEAARERIQLALP